MTDPVNATFLAFNATTDIDLGPDKEFATHLRQNVEEGKIPEQKVREAVKRRYRFLSLQTIPCPSMRLRMLLGDFDPKERVEYQNYGYEHLNTPEYKAFPLHELDIQ